MWAMTVATAVMGAGLARGDVTGSSDGTLVVKNIPAPISVAGVLSQAGTVVTGTLAIGGDASTGAGAYMVHGKATPKRVKVAGILNGVAVSWRAKITGTTLAGRARLKGGSVKLVGTLTLTHNPPLADGSACDGVFDANAVLFTDQVLATALLGCTACHVPGGQADATRFRVNMSDARASARSLAPLVDSSNADGSRILEKPLALVPHGGGQQITPGSSEDLTLRQWVGLIAVAGCS